ncbi:kinesin motor family protein [Salix suchowensis]|nr:kinesin motor family protein [Salix suchowensis]
MKGETSENNRFLGTLSSSSIRNLLPRSMSSSSFSKRKSKKFSENTPPTLHPNIQISDPPLSPSIPKLFPPSKSFSSSASLNRSEGQIDGSHGELEVLDPPPLQGQVVVRIRAVNDLKREGGDCGVRKLSSNSVSIGDRKFNFDSVLDSYSKQEDVFELVGVPLVKSALAGYNSSILSYGETGSGKTYTMWGPPSAMVEDPSPSSNQGIVPRIFHMLFSEIQRVSRELQMKQINYQCRCSFLEIYNEQIGDLLDPGQRNLEIRDDSKNGLYVENLTEEYVNSYEDVTQILIKGLSSRKVGATSINSKSSRSHIVFTMIIESWCKGTSSKCFSSSKTSRISLVDLAGLDKTNLMMPIDNYKGKSSREIFSFSIPRILFNTLLRESLGGNAKLTVLCNISPNNRNNGETLRTLRFGQRVKFIKNDPVINEISEDDVNDLSDQIRQLKEELIRAKSDEHNSFEGRSGYFKGRNVRESLNHLRVSLNRSLMLPRLDTDSDNEVSIDENDVKELHQQLNKLHCSPDDNSRDLSDNGDSACFSSVEESFETDLVSDSEVSGPHEFGSEEINIEKEKEGVESQDDFPDASEPPLRTSINVSPCRQSAVFHEPMLSESPKIGNTRKSMAIPSLFSASQNNTSDSSNFQSDVPPQSLKQSENIRSSLCSSKMFPGPTESLAASLQRGLQIIDYHQRNSSSNRSSVSFSFEPLALKPCLEVDKVSVSLQKLAEHGSFASLLCASCKQKINDSASEVQDSGNGLEITNNREKDLESTCMEQATKIEQLNQLVEKYKQEREHYIITGQEGDKILPRKSKNQMTFFDEGSADEEYQSLKDRNKLPRFGVENNQLEIGEEKNEVENATDKNTCFDLKEKEVLLQEIQNLQMKLQSYTDGSKKRSTEELRSSLLMQSIQLCKGEDTQNNSMEEFERERQRWTEMESEWISLTDELRVDLQHSRQHAEKMEMELRSEKKSTEELDDALHRAVLGHARMVEHYADLQEKYNDLEGKHRAIMEGIAEVKRAAAKAGKKGGTRFAKSLAAELSSLRVEREREREFLKKENKSLKIQLRDTAEAVHAAGELLVRLREAEQAASAAEGNFNEVLKENEKLKKQTEKLKRKHKMEVITMKQYMAESRLPESALQPLYREDSDVGQHNTIPDDDDQAWRAELEQSIKSIRPLALT